MTKTVHQIVTDDEIDRVHGNANFGSMGRREVIDVGVLTYAFGYTSGYTMMCILREHKLISKPHHYSASLTKKGRQYLQAMFHGVPLSRISALRLKHGRAAG